MFKLIRFPWLKQDSIDCQDYVFDILKDVFGFLDCDRHITSLILNQENLSIEAGAWGEYYKFSKGNEAPLTTAEAIIALLSFSERADVNNAIKRACNYLIGAQNNDGGWKDLADYSVVDATGCVVVCLSEVEKKNIIKIPPKALNDAVNFILSQQNTDGGWCTVKNQKSKMHYTFFALWGLAASKSIIVNNAEVNASIKKGIQWILVNGKKNNDEGLSLAIDDAPSPVATALGILCFLNIGKKLLIKTQWVNYLRSIDRGNGPEEISDSSMVYNIRRVYNFRSIPWIIEALVRTGEKLDSELIQDALKRHKRFESPNGGFVSDIGQTDPVVWQTSWSIRMMYFLTQELKTNLKYYIDHSIKKTVELNKKIKNLEQKTIPERKVIKILSVFSVAITAIAVYLLYLSTSSSYGKIIWYPFAIGTSLIIAVTVAYYWHKRKRLNKFTAFLLSLFFSVINILLGLLP